MYPSARSTILAVCCVLVAFASCEEERLNADLGPCREYSMDREGCAYVAEADSSTYINALIGKWYVGVEACGECAPDTDTPSQTYGSLAEAPSWFALRADGTFVRSDQRGTDTLNWVAERRGENWEIVEAGTKQRLTSPEHRCEDWLFRDDTQVDGLFQVWLAVEE